MDLPKPKSPRAPSKEASRVQARRNPLTGARWERGSKHDTMLAGGSTPFASLAKEKGGGEPDTGGKDLQGDCEDREEQGKPSSFAPYLRGKPKASNGYLESRTTDRKRASGRNSSRNFCSRRVCFALHCGCACESIGRRFIVQGAPVPYFDHSIRYLSHTYHQHIEPLTGQSRNTTYYSKAKQSLPQPWSWSSRASSASLVRASPKTLRCMIVTARLRSFPPPLSRPGAASAISAYRGVKRRRLRSQGQEDDLLTPTGALMGRAWRGGVSWMDGSRRAGPQRLHKSIHSRMGVLYCTWTWDRLQARCW